MDLFESWGTGIRRIQESCKALDLPEPEFNVIGDMFRVNIYRATVPKDEPIGVPKGEPIRMAYNPEQAQKAIVDLLRENPHLSWVDLTKTLGISRTTLSKHINKLKEAGIIEYEGSSRAGRWIIK
jgi:predicted HTH transcriptional regulator